MTAPRTPFDWAAAAIRYTRRTVGEVPSNRSDRSIPSMIWEVGTCVIPGRVMIQSIRDIRRSAAKAKRDDCGNCGEYAAVVFDFLYLSTCDQKIEYAGYADPGDHAFVIVGRWQGTPSDPSTWNDDAVVADAWGNRAVFGNEYYSRMIGYPNRVHEPVVYVDFERERELGDYQVPEGAQSA